MLLPLRQTEEHFLQTFLSCCLMNSVVESDPWGDCHQEGLGRFASQHLKTMLWSNKPSQFLRADLPVTSQSPADSADGRQAPRQVAQLRRYLRVHWKDIDMFKACLLSPEQMGSTGVHNTEPVGLDEKKNSLLQLFTVCLNRGHHAVFYHPSLKRPGQGDPSGLHRAHWKDADSCICSDHPLRKASVLTPYACRFSYLILDYG